MKTEGQLKLFYFLGISFILINSALIIKGHYWFVALPLAMAMLALLFISAEKLLLIVAFLTPFSFNLKFASLGFSVGVPNEPLLLAATLMFFLRCGLKPDYDIRILKHPITIVVVLHLVWMLITSITSEIPIVSFKYFVSHLWFVVPMFFLGAYFFRDSRSINRFFWLYGVPMVIVVVSAFVQHSGFGFERKAIASAVTPFFNDHTHYAATLALIAPIFIALTITSASRFGAVAGSVLVAIFLLGVFLSYSRAAWMSVFIGAIASLVLATKIRPRYIVAGLIILGAALFINREKIFVRLQTQVQASSENVAEHFASAANIKTDASNVERINRWVSAVRMFGERPVVGWGPGTYQFVYAPFQLSEYLNLVTTNFGDVGNAHSEYIGPLSEGGLPAMVLMLLLVFFALRTGIKMLRKGSTQKARLISFGITIGLITYFSHGFLNNFLDTDKVAVLFWAMLAMLVVFDTQSNKDQEQNS